MKQQPGGGTRTLVLFDFDGTLIRTDSFIIVAKRLCGIRRFLWGCLRVSPWLTAWKLNMIAGGEAKERLFKALYGGMSAEKFTQGCRSLAGDLAGYGNEGMMKVLRHHQRMGSRVIIVSASVGAWVRPEAEVLGVGEVIATEAEVDGDGRLTGRFSTPNCNGEEKVRRIREYLGDELAGYEAVEAYGDSEGDIAMKSLAGTAQ